ncbi:N-acetylmuramoyl-L-alanine amidase CwlD [Paenactinomyces guangxiensis]|uniref:N-acetylmuramoyl-L-alanine amidase CwlD n=1 Tax=Paenactinomyces guangxiensis TaxID=1490290 RepID=A0A7W1WTT6_9BACL|nr:N-acetylmuramoyl-L-alanine amidase CwlD [Paenactinomyces guangxiensis]MBA4495925.1 N-acetylmuramoyl-L-alanine amidase CwlD [Paenactinomyces guangxiensis]MBH8592938.1 N-acetylmuramoyl-L-alanine amidase CwlD [Paenactinomyces guangxiensis]
MLGKLLQTAKQGKFLWLGFAFLVSLAAISLSLQFLFKHESTWMMPLSGKFIVIDPGHGGPDGGAVSDDGLVEKDVTLQVSFFLRDYLQEAGAFVIMTREKDVDLAKPGTQKLSRRKTEDLMRRIYLTKEKKADALISIHLNSFPSSRWRGAQTFYNPVREDNKKLATLIQSELIRNLGNTDRLAKQKGDVYILKESPVPTALVEVGFLSNQQEAALLASEEYQKKIAASIYYGVIRFYSGKEPPAAKE